MKKLTKSECWDRNLIQSDGYCSPFACSDDDGRAYVGDVDNINAFSSVTAAIEFCSRVILEGERLSRSRKAYEADHQDNIAAEYMWHCDAQLQIAALRKLPHSEVSDVGAHADSTVRP